MKVDTYSPNTGGKLYTIALYPIVVENHRVYRQVRSADSISLHDVLDHDSGLGQPQSLHKRNFWDIFSSYSLCRANQDFVIANENFMNSKLIESALLARQKLIIDTDNKQSE